MSEKKSSRLFSVDAIRGIDMFFIAGGSVIFVSLKGKTGYQWVDTLIAQFQHSEWHGFTFWDLILPLFLFIAGVSMSFSLKKGMSNKLSKQSLYKKVAVRMVILIILGIIYKNKPISFFEPSEIRYVSVLGRIGFACFVTSLLYLNFSVKGLYYWIIGILITYYAMLYLIPVPEYGAGDLSIEGNLVGLIDRLFLPGRLLNGSYDELGILTQFPAFCISLFGCIAGDLLQGNQGGNEKTLRLLNIGLIVGVVGLLWSIHFPINKKLWTSSFVMLTSGMCFILLSLFYWIIDVKGYQKWAFMFRVIGLNSLAVYFLYRFIDFRAISYHLFGGFYVPVPEQWHGVFNAIGAWSIVWLLLFGLYKKRVFIKI